MADRKIGAGLYIRNNSLHVDIPEILAEYNIEDTEENRDMCVEIAEKAARAAGLISEQTKVEHTHKHRCPMCSTIWQHQGKRKKCKQPTLSFCAKCSS